MKRIFTLVSLVIMASLLLAACGGGTPSHLDAIKKAKVIKVGTSADYPPFEFVDANGKITGFDVELMAEVAKRMDLTLEWVDMPFDSLIAGVQEGKIDASIAAFYFTEERDKVVDFTDPYYISEDAFTVAEASTITITDPEKDLAAYKIGVLNGSTQEGWLSELVDSGVLPSANLSRYDRADQIALDLKSGRVEIMMSDAVSASALSAQVGGLKIIFTGTISGGPMNIVIPDGDTELAQAINDVLKQLHAEGFVKNLAIKYFSN